MNGHYTRRTFIGRSLQSGANLLAGSLLAGGVFLGTLSGSGCRPKRNGESISEDIAGPSGSISGAGKEQSGTDPCKDMSSLKDEDLQVRKNLGYEAESPMPDRQCGNCNLWLPPKENEVCGACTLFKGPVPVAAYCTYWAPQV